jgi:hypothetical protein
MNRDVSDFLRDLAPEDAHSLAVRELIKEAAGLSAGNEA